MGMRTGELARAAGVNDQTLRYYERRKLLPLPERTEGGRRMYDDSAVRRIRFIKTAQQLGFTLDEIGDLLDLQVDSRDACDDVRERAEEKVAEIDEKIRDLRRIRKTLSTLIESCVSREPTEACPILNSLVDG